MKSLKIYIVGLLTLIAGCSSFKLINPIEPVGPKCIQLSKDMFCIDSGTKKEYLVPLDKTRGYHCTTNLHTAQLKLFLSNILEDNEKLKQRSRR